MTITYHQDLIQGSDEWLAARCGCLTASEMKHIITPAKLAYASNDKERAHVYELAAQRLTKYVEPSYIGDDMLRGMEDEIKARALYHERILPVDEIGFITNDKWGFTIGYSPDGLIGADGQIEAKSRRQKHQIETLTTRTIPPEYTIQLQTGLLTSERAWCDFISYSGGLPMFVARVYPDPLIQAAILEAARIFEGKVEEKMALYHAWVIGQGDKIILTERSKPEEEITE